MLCILQTPRGVDRDFHISLRKELTRWVSGDTKAGTYIASDRYGNKYFENLEEELPLRSRWVEYASKEYDPSQMEPGW